MQGTFQESAFNIEPQEKAGKVSNPVDFLVPGVMENTVMENS